MDNEPASRPAAALEALVAAMTIERTRGVSFFELESPSWRGTWGSRRTCWNPLSEGGRGSGAISHAGQRPAPVFPQPYLCRANAAPSANARNFPSAISRRIGAMPQFVQGKSRCLGTN